MQNRYRLGRLAGALLALGLIVPVVGDDALVRHFPKYHAVVNWQTRVVVVQGFAPLGKPATPWALRRAKDAAASSARRNLLGVATVIVPITGDQKRRQAMANEVLRAAARGKRRDRKLPDGRYQVTLEVALAGKSGLTGVLAAYLRRSAPVTLLTIASRGDSPEKAYDLLPATGEEDLLTPAEAKGPFTGLIVDARGLGIQTSMSPVIYDPRNNKVYAGEFADPDFVSDVGVVGYMAAIKAALATSRVGKKPLVVRAVGSPDEFRRCVSVSEADAARLLAAAKADGFLKKCAVTFVIDRQGP
ncbi:MAG: hypothetical protein HY321_18100 [Armatimonadetes bacterium]|nr:hypothetical protein [Armatimonadota bacterium]